MEHLRAELEIRGYWNCAKSLPKVKGKCKEIIERIKEECERGECFVDPEKVLNDIESVMQREENESEKDWLRPLVATLVALVIIETFTLTFLFLDYMKYKAHVNTELGKLASYINKIDRNMWLIRNTLSTLVKAKSQLDQRLKDVMWELRALELALSYLQR